VDKKSRRALRDEHAGESQDSTVVAEKRRSHNAEYVPGWVAHTSGVLVIAPRDHGLWKKNIAARQQQISPDISQPLDRFL
jgi:hypothetical protein